MQIHVRESKSRMDIYTILSRRNLDILTDYWFQYGRPRDILFPSRFTGGYLTVSTLEQVMRRSVRNAELPTPLTNSPQTRNTWVQESGTSASSISGAEMNFHPHIHAIVPGGGLDTQSRWEDKGNDFFVPVQVISWKFRGKYMEELKRLWQDGCLVFGGTSGKYRNLLGCKAYLSQLKDKSGPEMIKLLWDVDICKCRHCGGRIIPHHKVMPLRD